jgi:hypothetical protein
LQERLAQQLASASAAYDLRLWQNLVTNGLGILPTALGSALDLSAAIPGSSATVPVLNHPLYQQGFCDWPQCNQQCENFGVFIQHLTQFHNPDEHAVAQCRHQIEEIEALEGKLSKERSRLQAMLSHLQLKPSPDTTQPTLGLVQLHQPQQPIQHQEQLSKQQQIQQQQLSQQEEMKFPANLLLQTNENLLLKTMLESVTSAQNTVSMTNLFDKVSVRL